MDDTIRTLGRDDEAAGMDGLHLEAKEQPPDAMAQSLTLFISMTIVPSRKSGNGGSREATTLRRKE